MFIGLGIVTYVPSVAMGPVNALLRGKDFYEPLPGSKAAEEKAAAVAAGAGDTKILQAGEGAVRSMGDITEVTQASQDMCYAAEDVLDDDDIKPEDRRKAWRDSFEDEEITEASVIAVADDALKVAGTPEAYIGLQKAIDGRLKNNWQCKALETLLGPEGDKVIEKKEGEEEESGF